MNNNNNQEEYYLTDIIEIIKDKENIGIGMLCIPPEIKYEIMGVNTMDQLNDLYDILKNKIEFGSNITNDNIKL